MVLRIDWLCGELHVTALDINTYLQKYLFSKVIHTRGVTNSYVEYEVYHVPRVWKISMLKSTVFAIASSLCRKQLQVFFFQRTRELFQTYGLKKMF